VDEHDMADLKPGQTGTLRLAGFPDLPLPLTIDRIVPVAVADAGGNYFRVEAAVVDPPNELRPGMEGVAKVVVGRGSLLWIWTHEVLGRLRLWAWNLGV
jgi:multidrug efflux pump subunit AcrA (membrane-fusion protein)